MNTEALLTKALAAYAFGWGVQKWWARRNEQLTLAVANRILKRAWVTSPEAQRARAATNPLKDWLDEQATRNTGPMEPA